MDGGSWRRRRRVRARSGKGWAVGFEARGEARDKLREDRLEGEEEGEEEEEMVVVLFVPAAEILPERSIAISEGNEEMERASKQEEERSAGGEGRKGRGSCEKSCKRRNEARWRIRGGVSSFLFTLTCGQVFIYQHRRAR